MCMYIFFFRIYVVCAVDNIMDICNIYIQTYALTPIRNLWCVDSRWTRFKVESDGFMLQ